MSKKQTLKSLLGGSDDRVQVSYNPSEITLSPTVQQTKGSSTVVQAMPRTNQALNFATALNQVPQVMGQMKNIGQAQALEDFSQLSDEERDAAMADDKKISNWLGYDKAFQESLVKDYFVRNANSITQRFTELANNPAQYESDQGFDDALSAEKQALIGELSEKFGNNPNRVMAINAIGDQVMTKVIGESTEMYETNKVNYALDMEGAFLQTQIVEDGVDPTTAISNRIAKIKTLPDVDNKKVKEFFATHTVAIGTELMNNEQYEKATEVVQAALDYQFFKGAKVSGDGRKQLSNLLKTIEAKADDMPRRVKNQVESTKDSYGLFITNASLGDKEGMVESATSIFTELGFTEEQLEAVNIDTTSPNSAFLSVSRGLVTLLNSNPNEFQREVLLELNQSMNLTRQAGTLSKAVIGSHSSDEYKRFATQITDHVLTNLSANPGEIILKDDDGRTVSFSDPRVSEALVGAKERIEWYSAGSKISQFDSTFREVTVALDDLLEGVNPQIKQSGYAAEVQDLLLSEGQRLWDESGGDFTIFNKEYPKVMENIYLDIETEINERQKVLKNNANRIKELNVRDEKIEAGEERSDKDKFMSYKYNSLAPEKYNEKVSEFGGDRDAVANWGVTERQSILEADAKSRALLLPAHLIRYGFPTFDSVDTTLLRQTGLGIADIPLGMEIVNTFRPALEGYSNQLRGEPTTREQRNAVKKFEDKFGIKFREDLMALVEARNLYETELLEFNQ